MVKQIFFFLAALVVLVSCNNKKAEEKITEKGSQNSVADNDFSESTLAVMSLVTEASELFQKNGEKAFDSFRISGSRWRQGEQYVFVIGENGFMEVHADSSLEGKNQMGLTDINGKLIVKGLLQTAAHSPQGKGGWFHYQWYIPGGLFPRWKSSYVMPVVSVTGKKYIIGSGIYTDKMERGFVTDMVNGAIKQIETKGDSAFAMLHDKSGPFLAKDAYIFVLNMDSVELVNPAFPGLEGRNLKDIRDTEGKLLVADMFKVMNENGSGWVDYMWPKPGASVSSTKSTFVKKASYKGTDYLVGCGVYLADAVKSTQALNLITSTQLVSLVNEAADVFMQKGENAYPEFREKGGKWFRGDTYFFVWSTDGIRKLNVSNPSIEGRDVRDFKDVLGRPIGKMILEVGNSKAGEGWVHYIYPEPGSIFPIWKSSYVKRVTFPSGKQYIIGCGIYNMDLDKPMVENLISQAAALVEKDGKKALPLLRDPKGPFVFMDTYIFMVSPEGIELFNAAVPQLEGKNIIDAKDLKGNNLIRDEISLAMKNGQGWLDGYWYRPGDDKPALKHTFVKRIQFEGKPCVIGSGFYPPAE